MHRRVGVSSRSACSTVSFVATAACWRNCTKPARGPASSTEAQCLIEAAQVTRAAAMPGRPHELECVSGDGLVQDGNRESILPAGMCILAASTYTTLLSSTTVYQRMLRCG